MTMDWQDPKNDSILLRQVVGTSKIKVKAKKIASTWPGDEEKPTPAAISMRLNRMRKMYVASTVTDQSPASNGGGNANPSSVGIPEMSPTPAKGTIRRAKRIPSNAIRGGKAVSGTKRKLVVENDSDDDADISAPENEDVPTKKKTKHHLGRQKPEDGIHSQDEPEYFGNDSDDTLCGVEEVGQNVNFVDGMGRSLGSVAL